jgi:hypothetical protein
MDDRVKVRYEIHGFTVGVEWPAGLPRMYGKDNSKVGKTSYADYGFFEGTTSADGGGIDVYVGPQKQSKKIYLLLQKPTSWDVEHGNREPEPKYMLGFGSIDDAEAGYRASMPEEYFLSIGEVGFEDFVQTIKTALTGKTPVVSKSNNASEDYRLGYKQTKSQAEGYLESAGSSTANQQTPHTAEMSPEPPVIEKGRKRKKHSELIEKLKAGTPETLSEGLMSREAERRYARTPLVRGTRVEGSRRPGSVSITPKRQNTIMRRPGMAEKSLGGDGIRVVFKL